MEATSTSYERRFEQRPGYLYSEITAPVITVKMASKYLDEVAKKCRELNAQRLMIERHIPVTLSSIAAYEVIMAFFERSPEVRFVFVEPEEINLVKMDLGIRIAHVHEVDVEVFDTVPKAEHWLMR